jgi:replicative DNA helicase
MIAPGSRRSTSDRSPGASSVSAGGWISSPSTTCRSWAPSAENRNLEIAGVSAALRAIAKDFQCPVMVLSQLSRDCERRPNKRPMADLRDSGALEQDADVVLGLYRDEFYNPTDDNRGLAELLILKHRMGRPGQYSCCGSQA